MGVACKLGGVTFPVFSQDTGHFKFPLELDMTPYSCGSRGDPGGGGGGGYELYSVVVHSGSTHSGHYTAYIRDLDDLGSWTHPVSPRNTTT